MAALPYNLEAEAATIGSAMTSRAAATEVAPWLKADAFYHDAHRAVWSAVLAVLARGAAPNLLTVSQELLRDGALERVGGMDALGSLIALAPGVAPIAITHYAQIVEGAHIDRQLMLGAQQAARIAQDDTRETAQKIADIQQVFAPIQPHAIGGGLLHIGLSLESERARIRAMQAGTHVASGVATEYRDLDELTGGLQPTDLIILAARPSVGKTAFALSMGYNIADRADANGNERDVVIFSLEMSREQLQQRLVAMHTHIDTHRLRTGHLSSSEIETYVQALDEIAVLPLFIDDTPAIDLAYLRHKLYQHIGARGTPSVVLVDYLQLMAARGENRVQEVSVISRGLKALAKEFHVPVIALSQLSRAVEGRQSHIPMLSDLRESGSIEQDSDLVMFLYREELYDRDTDKKGVAELHIAKHRNGPIGVIPMRFDAATTRFETLSYRTPEGY